MTTNNISNGISTAGYLITQTALLIIYYGGYNTNLPWFVVWFPSIIVIMALIIIGIMMLIMFIMIKK